MDDVRQKRLPAFLQEVQVELPVMDAFLNPRDSQDCDPAALAAAFRAIHTLKGTAGLLKADAVRTVAGRVEAILEKHLLRKSCPTQAEYDALHFARERIAVLIDCYRLSQAESPGLVKGVLRALDLVEAFPGQTGYLTAHCAAAVNEDPFAEDCVFDPVAADLVDSSAVHTAEAVPAPGPVAAQLPDDPFGDDHRFGLSGSADPLGADLFADDPDF
jgi:chemotaxis protein histidine kinase CheA